MLELDWNLKPPVLSLLVDRNGWRWKGRVCEGTDRHSNDIVTSFCSLVDRRTALGAEAKRELRAFISHSNVLSARARDLESRSIEPSLLAEYAARSPLTGQTVADRYSKRLALHFDLQLTTRA
jgi:hypothetical protein